MQITSNFVIPSEYWVEEKKRSRNSFRNTKRQWATRPAGILTKAMGAAHLEGTVLQACVLMAVEENLETECVEHLTDTRPNEGTTSGSSSDKRMATLLMMKRRLSPLGEMLLMLLTSGGGDNLTDSEDEWDLFRWAVRHMTWIYSSSAGGVNWSAKPQARPRGQWPCLGCSPRQASQLQVLSSTIFTQGLSSQPPTFPQEVFCFLCLKKLQKNKSEG